MDKNWVTAPIPLNEKVIVWIKSKIKGSKSGTIVIEMKDSKVISVHYNAQEFTLDLDK
ncbi:MAG: hypothetical protein AABZ65_04290 [Candidatus Omnitrophota bacterium]